MNRKFLFLLAVVALGLAWSFWPRTAKAPVDEEVKSGSRIVIPPWHAETPVTSVTPSSLDQRSKQPKLARQTQSPTTIRLVAHPPKPRAPITLAETPEHLKPVVLQQITLTADVINRLTANDKDILLRWYQEQGTNLLAKRSLTLALGYIGDEEVANLFAFALTEEYAGKKLTSGYPEATREEDVLCYDTILAMGLLSIKVDSAYEWIKQGSDPKFWKEQVKWTSRWGDETIRQLTVFCIQAIGGSGRADSLEIIQALSNRDWAKSTGTETLRARDFTSSIVQAAFYADLVSERGVDFYKFVLLSEEGHGYWRSWTKTENGQNWIAWEKTAKLK